MGQKVLLVFLIVTLIIVLWTVIPSGREGFQITVEEKIQDRFNPLSSQQNPLNNPAAPLGISFADASVLRKLTTVGLNAPTQEASSDGGFVQLDPVNPNSVRLDPESSLLGDIQFCKEKGKGDNPFSNPEFAFKCGMCMTSGKLLTGEEFSIPTGVVVYPDDKKKANEAKEANNHLFPRVIPSLRAAECLNASVGDNAKPVLAINADDYSRFKKRTDCQTGGVVGNGCGICEGTNAFSWVDPNGGIQPLRAVFYGEGSLTLRLGGKQVGQTVTLSPSTASSFDLGRVSEGTSLEIDVLKGTSINGPSLFGALIGTNANGSVYRLPIEKAIEKDNVTGSIPRRLLPQTFPDLGLSLAKLVARVRGDRMNLRGAIPLTFVESDQLASFDCAASPFVTQQASAELMIDDPCLRPKGQRVGNYSEACLQTKVLEGGCSTEGTFYSNPPPINQNSLSTYLNFIRETKAKETTDPTASMQCRGVDISTPCDSFIGNTSVPSKECLIYLYKNTGDKTTRASQVASYTSAGQDYTSLADQKTQFCQPSGTMNPETPDGLVELQGAARGYQNKKGFEAVRQYLSDVFTKATGNLDINKEDSAGGRKTSWMKCFGVRIAEPVPSDVITNSQGRVTTNPPPANTCRGDCPKDMRSPQGNCRLRVQTDGNVVVIDSDRQARWSTGTTNSQGIQNNLNMQGDGNLVVYSPAGRALWSSRTTGKGTPPYNLVMQDDCNLVIYDKNAKATWSSIGGIVK